MTLWVRVRQDRNGLWYPEESKDCLRWTRPILGHRKGGYKTEQGARKYFYPEQFKPSYALGMTFPPLYEWAPGEEPKTQPREVLDPTITAHRQRWGACEVMGVKYGLRT